VFHFLAQKKASIGINRAIGSEQHQATQILCSLLLVIFLFH